MVRDELGSVVKVEKAVEEHRLTLPPTSFTILVVGLGGMATW